MILGDPRSGRAKSGPETTIDQVFQRAAALRPDAVAISDPLDRETFTDGAPHRLTFADAERIVSGIAARLRKLGLQTDAVVGIQLPNTAECVLTILGVIRAGMIAAPLPLLWRRADMTQALSQLGAKAIITASRIGDLDHCELAMQVAADVFPIRYVCGFGEDLPDGVVPFDDLMAADSREPAPEVTRTGNPAAHVALVTFDVMPEGPIAVARNHTEFIAGGVTALLEGGLGPDTRLLACCSMMSFAGLSMSVTPWLLAGGTLSLHHAFSAETLDLQCRLDRCNAVAIPAALAPRLVEAGLLNHPDLKSVLALWRTPERMMAGPTWQHTQARLVDLMAFGEIALLGSRRDVIGRPDPLPAGEVMVPRGSAHSVLLAEVARTQAGTLALRGPMVPKHAFPPGAERLNIPHLKADGHGFVDTRYACRADRGSDTFVVTAPPPGLVTVGGYRFVLSELENTVRKASDGAMLTALPDAVAGHRLAGISEDTEGMRATLTEIGVNPLLTDAFRDRRPKAA
jgi:hypothetical protein